MCKSRFTQEQFIRILKESEAGAKTPELWRQHAISEQTFYRSKLNQLPVVKVEVMVRKVPSVRAKVAVIACSPFVSVLVSNV